MMTMMMMLQTTVAMSLPLRLMSTVFVVATVVVVWLIEL